MVTGKSIESCENNLLYFWDHRSGMQFFEKESRVTSRPSIKSAKDCRSKCVNNLTCTSFSWARHSCYTAVGDSRTRPADLSDHTSLAFISRFQPCKPSKSYFCLWEKQRSFFFTLISRINVHGQLFSHFFSCWTFLSEVGRLGSAYLFSDHFTCWTFTSI